MTKASDPDTLPALLTREAGADEVFTFLEKLDEAAQAAAIAALTPPLRHRLPGKQPGTHFSEKQKALLKLMFDHTPDDEPETKARLLGLRFHLTIESHAGFGGRQPMHWDAHALRHLWLVLEALPPADVEDNRRLNKLIRYGVQQGDQAEGVYGNLTAAIGYDPTTMDQPDRTFSEGPHPGGRARPDPLYGVNAFNETVRHEVGHAVDAQLHLTEKHAVEPGWGGWRALGSDPVAVARAMAEAAEGPIHNWKDAAQREQLIIWLARRLVQGDAAQIDRLLLELPFLDEAGRAHLKTDPAVQAAVFSVLSAQPWMRAEIEGGVPVGGRIFQEAYANRWYSYEQAARARKVSLYQFRAPGEWFAEVYAAYYQPQKDQNEQAGQAGTERGQKLKARDPEMWAWMKQNVEGK